MMARNRNVRRQEMWLKAEALVALILASIMMRLSPLHWDRLLRRVPQCAGTRGRRQRPALLVRAVDSASTLFPTGWCAYKGLWPLSFCAVDAMCSPTPLLGTRPRPFVAHAWVEHDSAVLGDDADRIRRWYTVVTRFG